MGRAVFFDCSCFSVLKKTGIASIKLSCFNTATTALIRGRGRLSLGGSPKIRRRSAPGVSGGNLMVVAAGDGGCVQKGKR